MVLLFGQIVLMAAHIWSPITTTAEGLLEDENAPLYGVEEPALEADEAEAEAPRSPWRWVALALTAAAAGIGLFGAWRLYRGSLERNRWLAVLAVSALVIVWGVYTYRLIERAAG
jgi:hypothetical protein